MPLGLLKSELSLPMPVACSIANLLLPQGAKRENHSGAREMRRPLSYSLVPTISPHFPPIMPFLRHIHASSSPFSHGRDISTTSLVRSGAVFLYDYDPVEEEEEEEEEEVGYGRSMCNMIPPQHLRSLPYHTYLLPSGVMSRQARPDAAPRSRHPRPFSSLVIHPLVDSLVMYMYVTNGCHALFPT